MNIAAAISEGSAMLEATGIEEPRREAATLTAFATGRDRTFIFAHPEYELSTSEAAIFTDALKRRSAREPFHYITGVKEFYGLDFRVGPGVLIPRPETEILVEEAVSRLRCLPAPRFLEIGVGSGCVTIAILANLPDARAVAIDVSQTALEIARENAERHDVTDRIEFRLGETYAGTGEKFDAIVSNPPYIPETDEASLDWDVAGYEPAEALFSGDDGLSVIREIVEGAEQRLLPGGSFLMEIGVGQAAAVRRLLASAGLNDVGFLRDLQGIERVATARSRNSCI